MTTITKLLPLTFIFYLMVAFNPVMGQNDIVVSDNQFVKSQELVLGVPKASEKNLGVLTDIISKIPGLKYDSFCPHHNLVLITYDTKLFNTPEEVIRAIQESNFNMPIFVKEGGFMDANEMCK